MEMIFAVMLCYTYPSPGCRVSSWPSIFYTQAECEHQRSLMSGGRTGPRADGISYECWVKEVPAWRPVRVDPCAKYPSTSYALADCRAREENPDDPSNYLRGGKPVPTDD